MNWSIPHGGAFFSWLLQASWQGAVLAGLIVLTQRGFARWLSPGWRHGLWLLLILRLMLPMPPQSGWSIFNLAKLESPSQANPARPSAATPRRMEPFQQTPLEPAPSPKTALVPKNLPQTPRVDRAETARIISWLKVDGFALAFWIWGAGVCGLSLRAAWTHWRFLNRLRRYRPIEPGAVLAVLDECRAALGVRERIALIETEEVETPSVWGLWRRKLLLPDGSLEVFSRAELRLIFLHELAHLKRHDLEISGLVAGLRVLHWFNPALGLAFRRMQVDRELATDALALAHAGHGGQVPYGETILKVLAGFTGKSALPGLVGITEGKASIRERLRAIARHRNAKRWSWVAAALAVILAMVALTDAVKTRPSGKARSARQAMAAIATSPAVPDPTRRQLTIQTIAYEGLAPLTGVKIHFEFEDYSGAVKKAELATDAEGKATITFAPSNLKRLEYRAEKNGCLPIHGYWLRQQIANFPETLEVKLSPGIEIGGVVTGENGQPLAGAEIYFNLPVNHLLGGATYYSLLWRIPAGERIAVTDAAGTWKARCVYPGIHWANLRVRHPDYADEVFATEINKAMEFQRAGKALSFEALTGLRAQFALVPGVTVRGKVVNDAGQPMPELEVRCFDRTTDRAEAEAPMGQQNVKTDAQGVFRLAHMPPKRLYFSVQAPGWAPLVETLDPSESESDIRLRLKRSRPLAGRVQDLEGLPVQGARIRLEDADRWLGIQWEAASDDEGRFTWPDAPAGDFKVRIEKTGFITQRKNLQPGAQAITLKPMLRLGGQVIDAKTRQPVPRFTLLWAPFERELPQNRPNAILGSNGVYALDLSRLHADTMEDGYAFSFLFRVEAIGYEPFQSPTFLSPQRGNDDDLGEIVYDIELKPADRIAGIVIDAVGQPVAGAQVVMKTPMFRLRLNGKPQFEGLPETTFQTTDSAGRFQLSRDPQGSQVVVANEKGFALVEPQQFSTHMTIKLEPWGRIEGTVREHGQPVADTELWLSCFLFDRPGFHFKTRSDTQGHFAFACVPPVECSVFRMLPTGDGTTSGPRTVVRVKPNETATVAIGGAGRQVTGMFKVKGSDFPLEWRKMRSYIRPITPRAPANLTTIAQYEVWLHQHRELRDTVNLAQNYPIRFAEDGSFQIDDLAPGKYAFDLRIPDPRDPEAFAQEQSIGHYGGIFELPPTSSKPSGKPYDLGVLEVELEL
jgi:beta-lactamase regulating signal transducer with metallopeptidase domain